MLNIETVVTLDEAVARLPLGLRRNRSTIWRWCRAGVRGLKLEHGFAGGTLVTSMEALDRFFKGIAEARSLTATHLPSDSTPPKVRVERKRKSSREDAEAYLAELGI